MNYMDVVFRMDKDDLFAIKGRAEVDIEKVVEALTERMGSLSAEKEEELREVAENADHYVVYGWDIEGRWSQVSVIERHGGIDVKPWIETIMGDPHFNNVPNDPEHFAWFYSQNRDAHEFTPRDGVDAAIVEVIDSYESNVPWESAVLDYPSINEAPEELRTATTDQLEEAG